MTTKYDGEELNQIVSTLKRIDKFVVCAGTVKTMDKHHRHFLEVSNLDGTPIFGIDDRRYKIDLRTFPKLEKGEYSIDLIGEGTDSSLYIFNNNHDLIYNIPLIFSEDGDEYPSPNLLSRIDCNELKEDATVSISIQAKDLQNAVASLDTLKDTPDYIVFKTWGSSKVILSTSSNPFKQRKKAEIFKTIGEFTDIEYVRAVYPFDKFKKMAKSAEGTVDIYLDYSDRPILCEWSAKNHRCSSVLAPIVVEEARV